MRPEEIAAYIGAAAWLPQIIAWIYRAAVKAKMRIVPDQLGEVGFTNYGPIFNVRMAFFADNRDLIVDGFTLDIKHQDGEIKVFRWAGLGEKFSEITDASGNRQIVSRDQSPIAIKIVTQSFLEKTVRFQEPKYQNADHTLTVALVAHFNFVKQKNPDGFVPEILASREYFNVVDTRQKWFWWKPGRYTVTLRPTSPQKFELTGSVFQFDLQDVDVERLKRNLPLIDTEIRNVINSNLPDSTPSALPWQWVNVNLLRQGSA